MFLLLIHIFVLQNFFCQINYKKLIINWWANTSSMNSEYDIFNLMIEAEQFISTNLQKSKCMILVGPCKSGKTSLIKFFGGAAFIREDNDEGFPSLVDNMDIGPEKQPQKINEGTPFELTLLKSQNPEQIVIIEMPEFTLPAELPLHTQLLKTIFNIYVWRTVLTHSTYLHICLINPYQFITDDHKLIQYYKMWQKCVIAVPQLKQVIKTCISIIFSKPEYEDDKESLLTSLDHLQQEQSIGGNVSFANALEESRVYCFLGQDSVEGQGQEMLGSILAAANYLETGLFVEDWDVHFMENFVLEITDAERMKQIFTQFQNISKKLLTNQQNNAQTIKSLSLISKASTLSFIKSINQPSLKQQQKSLQSSIKQQCSSPTTIVTLQQLTKISSVVEKPQNYVKFLINLHNQLQNCIKGENNSIGNIRNLYKNALKQYWTVFSSIGQHKINLINNWLQQKLSIWKQIQLLSVLCHSPNNKNNHLLQQNATIAEDITKQQGKIFGNLLKNAIATGFKSIKLFENLGNVKTVAQLGEYKQLVSIFGESEGQDQGEEEQDAGGSSGSADPRIKRMYYKSDRYPDIYAQIKQKLKRIPTKTPSKIEQPVNQRQQVKKLMIKIERQSQNREVNLELLAHKLASFRLMTLSLQIYMEMADPTKLYEFLTQKYFVYLQQKTRKPQLEFIQNKLLLYLQQRSKIFNNVQKSIKFKYCLQACYDYLNFQLCETADEFVQMVCLSNEGQQIQSVFLQGVDLNQYQNYDIAQGNKDKTFLRYVSLSKADIVMKVSEGEQKCKKNAAVFAQIARYVQAVNLENKGK